MRGSQHACLPLCKGWPLKWLLLGGSICTGPVAIPQSLHVCLLDCRRLKKERQAAGIGSELSVSLVSRGPILAGLAPYARRAFLPLLQVRWLRWPLCALGGAACAGRDVLYCYCVLLLLLAHCCAKVGL